MSTTQNKAVVIDFIESIWNRNEFVRIDQFVSDDYHDHSFLPTFPSNKQGLLQWIKNTSLAFDHTTVIEEAVADDDMVAVRIAFNVTHIGTWRNIAATGRQATVKGFRFFKLNDGKIIAHWALIDGEALHNALSDGNAGCVLPQ